jgi:cytochrome c biogenesis protein
MSQMLDTPAPIAPPPEPNDNVDHDIVIKPSYLLGRLWHLFISMKTGLVLILGLAVLTLVGTLLVQAPSGLSSDPEAYAAWLDAIRPKYGGWTGVLDTLGFFSIFTSIWFNGIVVLLMVSILACSVNRAPRLWKRAVHPRTHVSDAFYRNATYSRATVISDDPEGALATLRHAFRVRKFRTVVEREGETTHVYADRFRWGPFGTVLAHLSLVVILIGALAGARWGFRNEQFAVPIGTKVPVGNGTGLTVEAKSFSDAYYANGAPSDYASNLVLYKNGAQVGNQTVRVNQPLRYEGVAIFQSFFGAAAGMHVASPTGKVLYDQGVPLLWAADDGAHRIGRFSLPDAGLTVFVIGAESGKVDPAIKAGQMQIEVYKAGSQTPFATKIVSQGKPVRVADLDFTFLRERQFTGLIVAHDPGAIFIWIGVSMLVVGIFLVFFFPNRRLWARIRPTDRGSQIHVAATSRRDSTFEQEFNHLIDDLELELTTRAHGKGRTESC